MNTIFTNCVFSLLPSSSLTHLPYVFNCILPPLALCLPLTFANLSSISDVSFSFHITHVIPFRLFSITHYSVDVITFIYLFSQHFAYSTISVIFSFNVYWFHSLVSYILISLSLFLYIHRFVFRLITLMHLRNHSCSLLFLSTCLLIINLVMLLLFPHSCHSFFFVVQNSNCLWVQCFHCLPFHCIKPHSSLYQFIHYTLNNFSFNINFRPYFRGSTVRHFLICFKFKWFPDRSIDIVTEVKGSFNHTFWATLSVFDCHGTSIIHSEL